MLNFSSYVARGYKPSFCYYLLCLNLMTWMILGSLGLVVGTPASATASWKPYIIDAWRHALPTGMNRTHWAYTLNIVEQPPRTVNISGEEREYYRGCKPHDCPDNKLAALWNGDTDQVSGLIKTVNSAGHSYRAWVGHPSSVEKACLKLLIISDNLNACRHLKGPVIDGLKVD
jgi:hypothetical protein